MHKRYAAVGIHNGFDDLTAASWNDFTAWLHDNAWAWIHRRRVPRFRALDCDHWACTTGRW